jgi:single-stranded DNA-binding protein
VVPARAGIETRRAEMGETYVTLWGNIATDPKRMTTTSGVSILKFRLACTASRRDPQTGEFTPTG